MCSALRGSEQKAREGRSSPAAAGELGATHLLGGADGWTCSRAEGTRHSSGGAALPSQRVRSQGCARAALKVSRRHASNMRRRRAQQQYPVGVEAAFRQKVRRGFGSMQTSPGLAKAIASASGVVGVSMMPVHGGHGLMGHASTPTAGSLEKGRQVYGRRERGWGGGGAPVPVREEGLCRAAHAAKLSCWTICAHGTVGRHQLGR